MKNMQTENNITFKLLNEWNVPTIPVSGEQETNIIGENNTNNEGGFFMSVKVGINGFGRIGSLAFQAALER